MNTLTKELTSRARFLRKNSTEAERILWSKIRGRQFAKYKFRRQVVLGPYIVDFLCHEARLIVEADGGQHSSQVISDAKRTIYLESCGYRVVRFWNNDILQNTDGVLETILQNLRSYIPD
jgi:very-short-patch-repair endonuclease